MVQKRRDISGFVIARYDEREIHGLSDEKADLKTNPFMPMKLRVAERLVAIKNAALTDSTDMPYVSRTNALAPTLTASVAVYNKIKRTALPARGFLWPNVQNRFAK